MPAMVRPDEPYDPDELKVPQGPSHERTVGTLRLAADQLLGPGLELFCDMNWYPGDGGNAVAPDLMILPEGTVVATPSSRDRAGRPKSYRQDELDGPAPSVVLEVESHSDTVRSMHQKLLRYQRLGAVAYLVTTIRAQPGVFRFGPNDRSLVDWAGRPMPEFGGVRVEIVDREALVTIAEGVEADSSADLVEAIVAAGTRRSEAQREQAEVQREQAEAQREQAEARAEALARQLKALGIEPEA